MSVLEDVYGNLFIVRPPVPATVNKAGANYKSEVEHATYSPRRAFEEWMAICEGILRFGGDAIFDFEARDDKFLGNEVLAVDGDGDIKVPGSREVLGNMTEVETGRVFSANGPWIVVQDGGIRAVLPNMLQHRQGEASYYEALVHRLAEYAGLKSEVVKNPYRWEGMADVATVGASVVLTYTVSGHYDRDRASKSMRSSLDGVTFASDFVGVGKGQRIYAELIYPHFHGDTVHFGARGSKGARLVFYAGGLYDGEADRVISTLGQERIVPIEREDAVEHYAGNSRQVGDGVLVPDGVSPSFVRSIEALGLATHAVPLFELFGKAGGGPACATLYLPRNLSVPTDAALRFSNRKAEVHSRRARIPERLIVDPAYFQGRTRG